jgi:hypothetical protein
MKLERNVGAGRVVGFRVSKRNPSASHRCKLAVSMLAGSMTIAGGVLLLTVVPAYAAASLTVTPSTGLTSGQTVNVTGSGFTDNSIGEVLECNTDAKQPTVALGSPLDKTVNVGCTPPNLSELVDTNASGSLTSTYSIISGTVGPPCGPSPAAATCPSTDSTGGNPQTDAAAYPCPPTAAQQAAGDTCELIYGDAQNESGSAPILIGAETSSSPPPTTASTTPTATPATTTPPASTPSPTTAATSAPSTAGSPTQAAATSPASPAPSSTSLASTGPGIQLWVVGLIGALMLWLGTMALALGGQPLSVRRLFRSPTRFSELMRRQRHSKFQRESTESAATPDLDRREPSLYPDVGSTQGLWVTEP